MGVCRAKARVTLLHRNVPNMIGQFTALLAEENVNIDRMVNKSKGAYAYTIIDVNEEISQNIVDKLTKVKDILRIRVIV